MVEQCGQTYLPNGSQNNIFFVKPIRGIFSNAAKEQLGQGISGCLSDVLNFDIGICIYNFQASVILARLNCLFCISIKLCIFTVNVHKCLIYDCINLTEWIV